MKKKNNKGFTLIELLAVIVILAVLVLVALPAVTSLMNKSRKGAFRTEALYFGQDAISTAYNSLLMTGSTAVNGTQKSNAIWHLSVGGDYLCMGLDELVNGGFSNKQNYTSYGGYVQLYVASNGTTNTVLNITNGKYYINTTVKNLASLTDVDVIPDVSTDKTILDTPAVVGTYTCPDVTASSTLSSLSKYLDSASSGGSTTDPDLGI